MDVLEGENVYGRPGDRVTGSYFSKLRSIKSRAATGRRCIKKKNELWERARIPFVGNVNVGVLPPYVNVIRYVGFHDEIVVVTAISVSVYKQIASFNCPSATRSLESNGNTLTFSLLEGRDGGFSRLGEMIFIKEL